MAQIDRLLAAVVTQRAEGLRVAGDDAVRLVTGGATRPLTRQALSAQQVMSLLREIAPPDAAREIEAGRSVAFRYAAAEGSFVARLDVAAGHWSATLTLDGAGDVRRLTTGEQAAVPGVAPPASRGTPPGGGAARPHAAVARATEAEEAARTSMEALLRELVGRGGSDLHLRCGDAPLVRKDGSLVRLDAPPLDDARIEAMLVSIMPERNREDFAATSDTDYAYEIAGVARFRGNAFRERRGCGAVFRVIPAGIPTVEELGLPACVQQLCQLTKGLVLVTGPTGSGKSTTLAAMIDLINRTRSEHILTIEDPIEFVHPNRQCLITQRHVGVHTKSFKAALRAALREDPDIVLVGELRDLETVAIAVETAETGHLVFGTLHTTTATGTVDRLIGQFPADRQEQIRVALSDSLKGVISQTLCRRIGGGRVAAQEILLSIPAVSNLIREGKMFQLPSVMQTSRRIGMQTLNDALLELVDRQLVEPVEAYGRSVEKAALAAALRARGHDVRFAEVEGAQAVAR
jgi:twitching motility protein PilT